MKSRRFLAMAMTVLAVAFMGNSVQAQDPDRPVTKKELDKLRSEYDKAIEDLEERLRKGAGQEATAPWGTTNFLITGYAFAGFTDPEHESSTFNAGLNPIFLWKLSDRIFFEGEIEIELEGDETEVHLEYANICYIVNDYLTVTGGKFLNPTNFFMERLHPLWINKLPNAPLPFGHHTTIQAPSQLGFQVRGAAPLNSMKCEYAVYVGNGPTLETEDSSEVGMLKFNNFEDSNNSKTAGGRFGFWPLPELGVGYGIELGRVDPEGAGIGDVDTLIQSFDLSFVTDCALLAGTIDIRGQWVLSDVDTTTYDPTGTLGFGPLRFGNERSGGYGQVAYRPTKLEDSCLKDLECVVRFDWLDQPRGAPIAYDQQRVTIGLNYWLGPSTVCKVAYTFDDKDDPSGMERDENQFFLQMAIGF